MTMAVNMPKPESGTEVLTMTPPMNGSSDIALIHRIKMMAACRFHQNALRALSENSGKKMTRSKANGIKFQHK